MSALPVVPRWFARAPAGPGLDRYAEPHVHRWFRANIWYLRGTELDLVIDPGMGIAPLRAAMAAEGQWLEDRPVLAIATHGHIDHMGGMHEFADRAIHAADAAALDGDEAQHLAPAFRAMEGAVTALPAPGWQLSAFTAKAAPATRLLAEGDRIELGDRALTVLHLPGHSPGSIGLFDEAGGTLFSGDALYDGELLDDLPRSDPAIYRETMDRLDRLAARTVHGGHGASFGRDRMRALIRDYLDGRRRAGCPGGH
ncbi:MBL fold metallo-hydrolase [Paralimibaculum aggregatum]|uniref:MBL fold metallo-hydrolase n=1 Tax=Paralimibaculum aggregatum TaxID=3036245 RepID=A0ABQ6LF20_9RHOB|nr:MBL fold metallo-hydrolase [Limibaculum sp. NKW23]GMG81582.1 MBL fold metallo-hydrolase [Limibaculum sp. NKW23]